MSTYKLSIQEYGWEVRSYTDNDREKFLAEAKRLIADHIDRRGLQPREDVKNMQFHLFTEN